MSEKSRFTGSLVLVSSPLSTSKIHPSIHRPPSSWIGFLTTLNFRLRWSLLPCWTNCNALSLYFTEVSPTSTFVSKVAGFMLTSTTASFSREVGAKSVVHHYPGETRGIGTDSLAFQCDIKRYMAIGGRFLDVVDEYEAPVLPA